MDASSFHELLNRYYSKTCSAEEISMLAGLLKKPEYDQLLNKWLKSMDLDKGEELVLPEQTADSILRSILLSTKSALPAPVSRVHFLRTSWFRYAAILLLFAGGATLFYLNKKQAPPATTAGARPSTIIQPGGNHAVLTLANGDKIILDDASIGALVQEGNTKVVKVNAGQIAYEAKNSDKDVLHNTISTPKGGQYQIVLSDGTNVWLNSASSITFPTAFGKERHVTITGEAYMEVASNTQKPFVADVRGVKVNVLGTAFNVNAYTDEPSIKTVLAEGSVQVLKDGRSLLLKPGQQCAVIPGHLLEATAADLEESLAWKNGAFFFRRTNIADAMRQLSRWYDVEVVYEKGVPEIHITGEMQRSFTLAEVLKTLEDLGVHFRVEDKRLIVMNDQHVK